MLTLFNPATGKVRLKGVTHSTNAILHPWFKEQLSEILKAMPDMPQIDPQINQEIRTAWQKGLSRRITFPQVLPSLRMLLVWDNLKGHHTPEMVLWLFAHGVMPLFTPVGWWLNMAESIQRILVRRGLVGQNPESPKQIIAWMEAVAHGWNQDPTPFEWEEHGQSAVNVVESVAMSWEDRAACARRPLRAKRNLIQKWQLSSQLTHEFLVRNTHLVQINNQRRSIQTMS